jgi:hypothetical protein
MDIPDPVQAEGPMKLPLWYQARNGKWVPLTYFPDGEVGLTMQQVIDHNLLKYPGYGMGMGYLHPTKFIHEHGRFILLREKT